MFIKENLGILHKHYVSLANGKKTEDQQYLIGMEITYLPLPVKNCTSHRELHFTCECYNSLINREISSAVTPAQ